MLVRERNAERLEVRAEVLGLAPADDGEDVWGLLHHIRDGHCDQGWKKEERVSSSLRKGA